MKSNLFSQQPPTVSSSVMLRLSDIRIRMEQNHWRSNDDNYILSLFIVWVQILSALQKDEQSRRQRLRGKLEQVIDTMIHRWSQTSSSESVRPSLNALTLKTWTYCYRRFMRSRNQTPILHKSLWVSIHVRRLIVCNEGRSLVANLVCQQRECSDSNRLHDHEQLAVLASKCKFWKL